LPLLTRRDIQDAGSALRSSAIPPQFGAVHENSTSGATGQPVKVLRTALDALLWQANTLRDHEWHGRDPALKFAAIRALAPGTADPPHGLAAAGWGAASEAVRATGPSALLSLNAGVATQAAWLKRHAPGYLLTYPSNLAALLAHFAASGERLPGLRAVLTVGETVTPALRAACRLPRHAGRGDRGRLQLAGARLYRAAVPRQRPVPRHGGERAGRSARCRRQSLQAG